jgi:hypothetical protein
LPFLTHSQRASKSPEKPFFRTGAGEEEGSESDFGMDEIFDKVMEEDTGG